MTLAIIPAVNFSFDGFEVDAVLSEQHGLSVQLTDNPVEEGFVITDHRFLNSRTYSMQGYFTDTPRVGGDSGGRAKSFWPELKALLNSDPADLVTGLERIPNMVLTSLSVPISIETAHTFVFTGTWRELLTAESATVEIPPDAPKTADANKVLADDAKGRQPTKTPSDEEDAQGASLLSSLLGVGA